ncbi:MFS transporter [Acidianus sulfidivorans JP7]|uniref:MFS transporter n=1 Tax=Acidianus sulfidivorans TaxID=312539 RepID=UPI00144354A1|nr:MFS transporter [Acidianus sulfidivorans]AWR96820.2 MFS transporter [Acidianus sulfidivorans JP7]
MVQYKWIALSNTTISVLMASINGTIILISLPAIFRGININPIQPSSFQYLLWILMGYNVVTAAFLVTFGRLSDIIGRVRLYNLGFAIFTLGSILLFITPNTGDLGALELIIFRLVQGIGGAFLLSNSAAIITDAFPPGERGRALGINQIAALAGSLVGLILGGILATINWRFIFLVSVPVGILGTIWSYLKLKETGGRAKGEGIDWIGNIVFAGGLILILLGVTYGLMPYGGSQMGWGNPYVIASLIAGAGLLASFPFVERKVKYPMFRLELFKIKAFLMGGISQLFFAFAFGGIMIILIILLQGIWLPLHGYSYSVTPFWAGIYMIPMMVGFVIMGPISGALSDKYGARTLATLGLVIVGLAFIALSTLNYNFNYTEFATIIFIMGLGSGMFGAPNTTAIMNSVPRNHRGAASGMRSTLQNSAQTASLALFFTIIIGVLAATLPTALSNAVTNAGAPQLAPVLSKIPVTSALFSAFLGYNPIGSILSTLPHQLTSSLSPTVVATLTSKQWFPEAIAPSFMHALRISFYIGSAMAFIGAIISALRGGRTIAEEVENIPDLTRSIKSKKNEM